MIESDTAMVTQRAHLWVEGHVFNLGAVSGATPQGMCDELANRLEMLAKILRGPEATPAPPCEGCGEPMVHRRGHTGRYTVAARDEHGDVSIYGIHPVSLCVMVRDQAARLAEEARR